MPKINRERAERRRSEAFGPQAEAARARDCSACGRPGPSDPAHVRSRGAGGSDRGNVIPLCRRCHIQQHAKGWAWMRERYGLDELAAARALELEVWGSAGAG